ncbi:type II secretion system protein GspL [Aliikangiella maris]|uniref:Type II secretion system protein GspL n=2 Tax=Aliikangiella maris TaxID=3162458 RepID=A0ABV3MTD7_9GAMM
MSKLVIFWGDKSSDRFYWCVDSGNAEEAVSIASSQIESHEILKADLACMAEFARNKKVELVLSSNDIHFNQVELPNKAQRHLRKAIPFIIEEHVADAVDHLFFAIGTREASGKIPVRGVQLTYLNNLIEIFEKAEVKLDAIKVDLDLLKTPEEGLLGVLTNDMVLLKSDDGRAWSCYQQDFSWIVQRVIASERSEEDLPIATPLKIIGDNESVLQNFEQQLPVGMFAPDIQQVDAVEQYLTDNSVAKLNLLQGEFEPEAESSPFKNMLYKVASIAAMVLVAHLAYQGTQWFWLSAQNEALNNERSVLWKQAFPGRKEPSNPDKTLRTFLKTAGSGSGDASFLAMLNSTAELITDLNQIYPTNISYNSARNELRMDLIAKDLPVLNQYRDALKNAGHEVEMSSANQRGDAYSSRLIVRR